jgi:hypothetical protein
MNANRAFQTVLRGAACAFAWSAFLLAGCGGDGGLAPHDELTLTRDEAAGQSGYLAWALAQVAPEFLDDPTDLIDIGKSADKDAYVMTFTGAIVGSCTIDFRTVTGGAAAPWDQAGYGHFYTAPGEPLAFYPVDQGDDAAVIFLDFNLEAEITQGNPDVAVVTGLGSIGNSSFKTLFTLDGLVVEAGSYPGGGSMTVELGPYTAEIEFGGDPSHPSEALMTLNGATYVIDLETGETTLLVPTS